MPHIHDLYDYSVSGVLIHDDKTLLIRHKELPIWSPPSGHVDLDQTPLDALYVEIWEEAGIDRSHLTMVLNNPPELPPGVLDDSERLPLPFEINVHDITGTHRHIDMGYLLLCDTDAVTPGPGESQEWKWFTAEELKTFQEIPENIRTRHLYALAHVRNLSRSSKII